jgi:acetyl/propionyl-CoA carboxylase alpha subunit
VDIVLAGDGVATDQDPVPVEVEPDALGVSAEAALLDEGAEAIESPFVVGLPPLPAHLRVDRTRAEGSTVMVEVDGVGGWFTVRRAGDWALVTGLGRTTTLKVLPRHPEASDHGHDHGLVTPVPGTVTAVLVEPGAHVVAGDTLVILEAMKMEHRIKADEDGVVAEVRVAVGDSVDAHHVVAVLEEE